MEWSTLEYEQKKKSIDWYWGLGIIAIALIIFAFVINNFLFGIFIIIGVGALILFEIKTPRTIHVKITKIGLSIDNYLYPFQTMKSFWINDHDEKLFIISDRVIFPVITLNVDGINIKDLRTLLKEHLKESEIKESTLSKIVDKIGI